MNTRPIAAKKRSRWGAGNRPVGTLRWSRRWIVERTMGWIGNFRRLTVRYDRQLATYRGLFRLACALLAPWLTLRRVSKWLLVFCGRSGVAGGAKRILHNAPQRSDTILPGDFFPLFLSASGVRDTYLKDPALKTGDLRDDLGLEAETILLDVDFVEDIACQNFVTAFHVRQIEIGEHVGHQRQNFVGH